MAETMRAAVYQGPGRVEVESRPVPDLRPGDVLVEVSHCGICGTDLHLVLEGMGRPSSIGGHEYSGRIAKIGEAVDGWQPGDRVVINPCKPACGRCEYCRESQTSLCLERGAVAGGEEHQGGFAELTRVAPDQLYPVPDGLSLRAAALAEPLAVALHGIKLAQVKVGQRILITGAGPVGSFTLAALRAQGLTDITVSEPLELRRGLASRLGATRVLLPEELDPPLLPFDVAEDAYHVAFECSGNPAATEAALGLLRRGGRLVLVGTGLKRPRLDHNRVLLNELIVTGSYNYDENGFEAALELLASGSFPVDLLVEAEDVPLEGLLAAMHDLTTGRAGGKLLVAPKGSIDVG